VTEVASTRVPVGYKRRLEIAAGRLGLTPAEYHRLLLVRALKDVDPEG